MNDYGSITIDNRNLLDDLLGLSENNQNGIYQGPYGPNQLDYQQPFHLQQQPYSLQQQQPYQLIEQQQQFQSQQIAQQQIVQQQIVQQQNSFYMQQQRQQNLNSFDPLPPVIKNGQKVYLESPTFEKEEDDIYR